MTRWLPLPFVALMSIMASSNVPNRLPVAKPLIVTGSYAISYDLSAVRDSVVFREAARFNVPWRIAYAVTHSENYSGDSTAVSSAGAVGILQIHPINFGVYPETCYGERHITDMSRNACVGVRLLRGYYDQTGSWSAALRKYLGYKRNTKALLAYLDDIVDHMAGLDD